MALPPRRPLSLPLTALALCLSVGPLAGEEENVQTLNTGAVAAMDAGKWQDALTLLDRCVTRYDAEAAQRFGSAFGVSWYRKGVCELRLQKWQDAAKSFQKCYQAYPERGQDHGNPYNKRALLRWGEAMQGAGDPAEALRLYQKFLTERDKSDDSFQPASFYISTALCRFATGQTVAGIVDFETAVKNRAAFNTPDTGIAAAFRALVIAAIQARDEKMITGFIERNRGELLESPAEMEPCTDLYLALGAQAAAAGMPAAASAFYGLVPDIDVTIEDLRTRLEHPADLDKPRRDRFQAALTRLEEQRRQDAGPDVLRLEATAALLEKSGDLRGAMAAWELLERFHPRAAQREEHLFQLVRTAILSGDSVAGDKFSAMLAAAFPQSKRLPEIRRTLVATLFQEGKYEACARAAEELAKAAAGSGDQDAGLYFLGAGNYYMGRNKEAQDALDRQVTAYPQSPYRQAALWFQASLRSRQGRPAEAAPLLDAFLSTYPDAAANPWLPYALLERATCHVSQSQWPEALALLDRLEALHADAADRAWSLRGQALAGAGREAESLAAYRKALALAREKNDERGAAEASLELAAALATGSDAVKNDRELEQTADGFWKSYATQAPAIARRFAIVTAEPLARLDHTQEVLERLTPVIVAAETPADRAEAARVWARVFLRKHAPDELRDRAQHFPGLDPANKKAQAELRGAAILALDDLAAHRESGWEEKSAQALAALYQELKTGFAPEDLPSALLIRTGDFLRTTSSAPRQALPYYEEVLKRADDACTARALLGKAAVLAQGSAAERSEAQQLLDRSRDRFTSLSPAEQDVWKQVEVLASRKPAAGQQGEIR